MWTIHGLWPSYNETYPAFCDPTMRPLPYDALKPIEDKMRTYWPSIYGKRADLVKTGMILPT